MKCVSTFICQGSVLGIFISTFSSDNQKFLGCKMSSQPEDSSFHPSLLHHDASQEEEDPKPQHGDKVGKEHRMASRCLRLKEMCFCQALGRYGACGACLDKIESPRYFAIELRGFV